MDALPLPLPAPSPRSPDMANDAPPAPTPASPWRAYLTHLVSAVVAAAVAGLMAYLTKQPLPIPVPPVEWPAPQMLTAEQEAALDNIPFCGRTENLSQQATFRPWPQKRIAFTVEASGPTGFLTQTQVRDAFAAAWKDWADALDIEPYWVDDPNAAHVRTRFGAVLNNRGQPDGPLNILAWSELSDGTTTPKHQLFDSAEAWGWDERPDKKIDLQRVACHEIGHVLGLVHDEPNSGTLMAPTYSLAIRHPVKRDVDRAVALGYRPRPNGPPVPPPGGRGKQLVFEFTGNYELNPSGRRLTIEYDGEYRIVH